MSGSESAVWRDGELMQGIVPPEGAEPVREVGRSNPRDLAAHYALVTLRGCDGHWSVRAAAVDGVWLRKSDRQPGTRHGNVLLSGPLTVEDGAPEWLVERSEKLVTALNNAFREAER